MTSDRLRVGLFAAGYLGADIRRICRLLKAGRHRYDFEIATPIRNLGDPDLFGYAYSDKAFEQAVTPHSEPYDLCVVLTGVPLQDNYFTRDIDKKVILCTSDQSGEYRKASGRSIEEYFALSVCPELISVEFQRSTGRSWEELLLPRERSVLFGQTQGLAQPIGRAISVQTPVRRLAWVFAHRSSSTSPPISV